MQYRTDKDELYKILSIWNSFIKKKVHLIACGGTALTLIDIKESTKDVDFILPVEHEYRYLIRILSEIGYERTTGSGWAKDEGFIFDLFLGKSIFTTELLESPLKEGNNFQIREFSFIYLGILNYYDLIISKLFRGSPVDIDDCKTLFFNKEKEIDIQKLKARFIETSSYDISDERIKKNLACFLREINKE